MGKEFQMARSKGNRKPNRRVQSDNGLLLAGSGPRLPGNTPTSRNKRKKAATTNKKTKGRAVKDTPSASTVGAEAERSDARQRSTAGREGHEGSDKDRQPNRGAKGADRVPRRSAKELGIEWIGSYCQDSSPHYLIGIHKLDGGSLFKCKYCKRHIWLPYLIEDASKFGASIDYLGAEDAYHKLLDQHPEARMLVAKLQDLWYARQRITDMDEFMMLVISVMEDKEYDRRENSEGDER